MKVLLVTSQKIGIQDGACWCNFALYGTLENMSVIGEMHLLCYKATSFHNTAQPITERIGFLSPNNVDYFLPISKDISTYLTNQRLNKKKVEQAVEGKDLVIGYAPFENAAYAQKVAEKKGIPFLSFLVGCPWNVLIHHHRLLVKMMAPKSWLFTRRMLKNSNYVHYVTRFYLQDKYPTKGKSLGCSDINLCDFDLEAFNHRMKNRQEKTPSSEIKLITVGSLDAGYKGQEYVIRAMAQLKRKGDNRYHYYLIGTGKGERLHKIAQQLNIEDQVHFLGRKTIDEVFSWLDECDIYLQPSLTEGLPRSVVEAMSRALPCIGFHTGGIPELLEPQYVVKQKDVDGIVSKLRLLENENEYKRVAEQNYKEAQNYDHEKLQKQIRDFFYEIKKEIEAKL